MFACRRAVRVVAAALVLSMSFVLSPAARAADAQADRMRAAYRAWVKANLNPIGLSSLVVMRGRTPVVTEIAGLAPYAAQPVAHVSLTVTGLCVAKLVEARRLRWDTPIGFVLRRYFKNYPAARKEALLITVGQLLSMTSGIRKLDKLELVGKEARIGLWQRELSKGLSMPLRADRRYEYNALNYIALALVIEELTGKRYEDHCRQTVLVPAGAAIGSKLDPDLVNLAPIGGWSMSPYSVARMMDHFRPGSLLLKTAPETWPKGRASRDSWFTLGTFLKKTGASWDIGLTGAIDVYRVSEVGKRRYVTITRMWKQNLRYVVTVLHPPTDEVLDELRAALLAAAYP